MTGRGRRGERIRRGRGSGDKMMKGCKKREQRAGAKNREEEARNKNPQREKSKMVEEKRKVGLKDEEGAAKGNAKEAVTGGDKKGCHREGELGGRDVTPAGGRGTGKRRSQASRGSNKGVR